LNDVLRIADIEEAKSPVSIKEDNAFSLRAENGKFVMHFSSAQKTEILQAISAAKARHRKEFKASECHDRLIKPADVPGSLLNIALMNLASRDRALRLASYNAIAGLSRTFHFDTDKRLITAKGEPIAAADFV
jgi:neurofibromin 1